MEPTMMPGDDSDDDLSLARRSTRARVPYNRGPARAGEPFPTAERLNDVVHRAMSSRDDWTRNDVLLVFVILAVVVADVIGAVGLYALIQISHAMNGSS